MDILKNDLSPTKYPYLLGLASQKISLSAYANDSSPMYTMNMTSHPKPPLHGIMFSEQLIFLYECRWR